MDAICEPLGELSRHELLSGQQFSSQPERGWFPKFNRGQHQQREHGCGNLLHRCTSLDAFTWGILAVLTLELAKQLQWLHSLHPCGRRAKFCQLESRLAVLPLHQHSVPPATASAPFSGGRKPHFFLGADTEHAPKNQSPSKASRSEEHLVPSETGDSLPSPSPEPASVSLDSQGSLEHQKSFDEAASQLQQTFQASVSMAFNILGLEHLQKKQYAAAFHLFKLAADQNYSKAQLNVGLCYEHGRGTEKDMAKAALYYQRAAHQGHPMAQYRYAKWLLRSWPKVEEDSHVQEAVDLLDQAAAAGLTQAQVYLGRLCLKGLKTGRKTALKYLHMVTKSEDSLSKLPLGVLYEKGFGRAQNQQAAEKPSRQVEVAGSKPAQESITAMITDTQSQHLLTVAPRSFFSSPCLQSLSQPPVSHIGQPVLDLIHSQSTGNLRDVSCLPHPAFPDCFSLSLRPLNWSPGIAIG
ncbi:death ligand signal enhancer [Heteronotia binoei]|uniref:death ligand signal enhancer n=1 Tax=Heteronotia binoei TaxID=13085 RepID=UPI00292DF126|nr:death ligand signal enhancer [Heteronotia binoei]